MGEDGQLTNDTTKGGLNTSLSGRRTTFARSRGRVATFPRERSEELVAGVSERTRIREVFRGID